MGMSSYILDGEEQFDTKVEAAVKQSECVDEAVAEAMKHRSLVAHMTDDEVVEYVHEGWNEIWSNYLQGAPMKIIRSKRTVAWLNNRTNLNPPKLFSTLGKKGLTKQDKDATVYKQLEFNFMRAT